MPTISVFYGIVIQMFWQDHAPPHFHALYAEHEALIDLRNFFGCCAVLCRAGPWRWY
jgi:Domain of unknown function (DUF4160)